MKRESVSNEMMLIFKFKTILYYSKSETGLFKIIKMKNVSNNSFL
ncbi:hypothetical protein yfred0001_10130 [Yersinia frederiksenii ATCC 33641]|nr:hypothetical protein yfred0001_10130 [Yersinia frederiksenii ATCC 33641]